MQNKSKEFQYIPKLKVTLENEDFNDSLKRLFNEPEVELESSFKEVASDKKH